MRQLSGLLPAAMGERNCDPWVTAFHRERR
jgi:hypothetical protein